MDAKEIIRTMVQAEIAMESALAEISKTAWNMGFEVAREAQYGNAHGLAGTYRLLTQRKKELAEAIKAIIDADSED